VQSPPKGIIAERNEPQPIDFWAGNMTFTIHYSILGYLYFRESDAKRGRLIKAHCDQARKGAGTVGKLRIILELEAQRERFKYKLGIESLSLRFEL
jgi:hypothetical protein